MNKSWKWKTNYLKNNKEYLKRGTYSFLSNCRTLVCETVPKEIKAGFPSKKLSFKEMLMCILAKRDKVKVDEDGDKFKATVVYFSNEPKDTDRVIKFFDYESMRVLTKCQHDWQFNDYLRKRENYSKYFQVPSISNVDERDLCYTEEIIQKINYFDCDKKKIFILLADLYNKHFQNADCVERSICLENPQEFALSIIKDSKPFVAKSYLQHGDLSIDNFIFNGEKIIFIDFEHADYYVPYYDLFFLIVNSYVINGDETGIEIFLSGELDDYIGNTFCGMERPVSMAFLQFVVAFCHSRLKQHPQCAIAMKYMDVFERIFENLKERGV